MKTVMFVILFMISMVINAMDYDQFDEYCSQELRGDPKILCDGIYKIKLERENCTRSEQECDEKELSDSLTLYWSMKLIGY